MPEMTSVTNADISDTISKPFITECNTQTGGGQAPDMLSDLAQDDVRSEGLDSASEAGSDDNGSIEGKECNIDEDAAWDTDLEIEVEKTDYNLSGSKIYLASCRELNVVPVSYFLRHMMDEDVVMRHHGLGPSGAKALAIPLLTNTSVTSLDISDNWVEAEGATHLAEMLKDNCYITYLTVSDNRLGSEGATVMCDMLLSNTTLASLNLAGNGFTDKDAEKFANALLDNTTLREINLSHNDFGVGAGFVLGHAIGENESLDSLDLSWNHFRGRAALDIVEGITVNSRLKSVCLAWNGLGDEGAVAIAECLKQNHIITYLDISNNRITADGVMPISKALDLNETLITFKIGQNAMGANGALMLVNSINNERSILTELNLLDICVDAEFEKIYKDMRQSREIEIHHGGVLGSFGQKPKKKKKHELGPEERLALKALEDFLQSDPMARLQDHVETKNLRLIDLFRDLDKNKDYKIGPEDLKRKVKATGIDMSEDKIDRLIDKMDKDNSGNIDYSTLVGGKAQTKMRQRRLSRVVIETFESTGRTGLPGEVKEMSAVKMLMKKHMPKSMSETLSKTTVEDDEDEEEEDVHR